MKHYNHELLNRVGEKKNKTEDAARSAKCIHWHICTYFHSFYVSELICTEQVGIAWGASGCVSTLRKGAGDIIPPNSYILTGKMLLGKNISITFCTP